MALIPVGANENSADSNDPKFLIDSSLMNMTAYPPGSKPAVSVAALGSQGGIGA